MIVMTYIYNKVCLPVLLLLVISACTSHPALPEKFAEANTQPRIFPDYTDVTVPCNIAPLNFSVQDDEADECVARFTYGEGSSQTYGDGLKVQIPLKEWRKMLEAARGDKMVVEVWTRKAGEWTHHKPFAVRVAEEEIDPYISYRVISPSYIGYEMLSINQRNLTDFDETVVYNNMLLSGESDGQCINCHSYQNYRTDNMQFHMRQGHGGTMIVSNGTPRKVNLKTDRTISAGVYPSWHPTLPFIAYSTNETGQSFHTKDVAKIEVQDAASDLILYDIERNEVSTVSAEPNELEVYPWWSPDGRTLYYASAYFVFNDSIGRDADAIERYEEIKYDLYRRSFNPDTRTFGPKDTVFCASAQGKSATLPRISPDGRYLLFSMGSFGCFHIWHPDADLYLMDLQSGSTRKLENVNSPQAESYHSWSSNGRWMLFSSRRDDGNYTRLYMAYFDRNGRAHKAFELPQEDPEFYHHYLRSYNIPEFMVEPVSVSPHEFAAAARKEAVQAKHRR